MADDPNQSSQSNQNTISHAGNAANEMVARPETVGPDEILSSSGASEPVVEGTYTQRAGMKLAK